jgi:hypothetical protein
MEEQLDDSTQLLRQLEERSTQSAASNRVRESHLVRNIWNLLIFNQIDLQSVNVCRKRTHPNK